MLLAFVVAARRCPYDEDDARLVRQRWCPDPENDGTLDDDEGSRGGRYWARTSDLRLVEAALSQLS
jgi:hypothetical protein